MFVEKKQIFLTQHLDIFELHQRQQRSIYFQILGCFPDGFVATDQISLTTVQNISVVLAATKVEFSQD